MSTKELNKDMFEPKIKKDCFGYDPEKRECRALNCLYCKTEQCSFYKTQEVFNAERRKYPVKMV